MPRCPLKWPEKRDKTDVVTTTTRHPDFRSQMSRWSAIQLDGWMPSSSPHEPTRKCNHRTCVSFSGKFSSGSSIDRYSNWRDPLSHLIQGALREVSTSLVVVMIGILFSYFALFQAITKKSCRKLNFVCDDFSPFHHLMKNTLDQLPFFLVQISFARSVIKETNTLWRAELSICVIFRARAKKKRTE